LCPSKHPTYIPLWNMFEKPKKRKTPIPKKQTQKRKTNLPTQNFFFFD
jgi:hypothetical protein